MSPDVTLPTLISRRSIRRGSPLAEALLAAFLITTIGEALSPASRPAPEARNPRRSSGPAAPPINGRTPSPSGTAGSGPWSSARPTRRGSSSTRRPIGRAVRIRRSSKAGRRPCPRSGALVFEGQFKKAHILFGRRLMGYPVEQQKYQALGNLVLRFPAKEPRWRTTATSSTWTRPSIRRRTRPAASATRDRSSSSPVDQVIVVRLTAERPGRISFRAQLRGETERGPLQLRHRLFPHGRPRARRARRPRQVGRLHGGRGRGCATRPGSRPFPKAARWPSTRTSSSSPAPTP